MEGRYKRAQSSNTSLHSIGSLGNLTICRLVNLLPMRSMDPVEKCMRDAKMDNIQIDDVGHGRRIITELGKFELTGMTECTVVICYTAW